MKARPCTRMLPCWCPRCTSALALATPARNFCPHSMAPAGLLQGSFGIISRYSRAPASISLLYLDSGAEGTCVTVSVLGCTMADTNRL